MDETTHGDDFDGEFDREFEQDQQIRQGDLLEFIPKDGPNTSDEWLSHLGVIVTADCDLVYGKHAGILSYIPIVPITVYLRLLMLPRIIDTQLQIARDELQEALPVASGWPTNERVRELIEQNRTNEIDLVLADKDTDGSVRRHIKTLAACVQAQTAYDPASPFEQSLAAVQALLEGLRKIKGHKPLSRGQLLSKELTARMIKGLPGDCFFLARPMLSATSEGYIAYLRLIREIDHDSIAKSPIEERRDKARIKARRVSRLRLIYLHRLIQQMTKVFADIGLPEQYERKRDTTVASQIKTWVDGVGTS